MLSNNAVLLLSLMCGVLLLGACQPKPDPDADTAASAASAPKQTEQRLIATVQPLALQLPDCKGKSCPEFSVERLSSNVAVVDATLDQAIVQHLAEMLEITEVKSAQTIKPSTTTHKTNQANEAGALGASSAEVVTTPAQQLTLQVQPYLDGFLRIDQEMKSLGAQQQISLRMKPAILQSKGPVVTVVLNTSTYLGGAHGAAAQRYYNFDLKAQQPLVLNDILVSGQKTALRDKAHAVFATWVSDNKLASNLTDYEQAWPFSLSDNFYLAPQGLILQYGEYEIGPYVVGLPRLVVPYNQLQGILKPQYLPAKVKATAVTQAASAVQPAA